MGGGGGRVQGVVVGQSPDKERRVNKSKLQPPEGVTAERSANRALLGKALPRRNPGYGAQS